MVKISMEPFVKLFQPDRYPNWMLGKDSAAIDHTHATPSTTPELQSWLQRRGKTTLTNKGYRSFFTRCPCLHGSMYNFKGSAFVLSDSFHTKAVSSDLEAFCCVLKLGPRFYCLVMPDFFGILTGISLFCRPQQPLPHALQAPQDLGGAG